MQVQGPQFVPQNLCKRPCIFISSHSRAGEVDKDGYLTRQHGLITESQDEI